MLLPWKFPLLIGGLLLTGCATGMTQTSVVAAPTVTEVSTQGVVDVTAVVAPLVSANALTVTADNALAGIDPARKTVKRLLVIYALNGQRDAAMAMEGETLHVAAPAGKTLKIEKALYGNIAFPIVDATEKLRALARNSRVSLPVNVELAGVVAGQPARDPAPGQLKSLRVDYRVGRAAHSVTVADGQTLELPKPADGAGPLTIEGARYGALDAAPDLNVFLQTTFVLAKPSDSTAANLQAKTIALAPPALQKTPIAPVRFEKRGAIYFADFGLDWFGNLQLTLPANLATTKLTVRLGEKLGADGSIDRQPGGSISFVETSVTTAANQTVYQPEIPSKGGYQNSENAIRVPAAIGSITPFRYVEIENSPVDLTAQNLRQIAVHTAFDDNASSFSSSDATLNAVWNLCKHTMKATTAFGVYVDGERERRPYEADAYINQLSHYAVDLNPAVARYSTEYLLAHPTWPTEWSFHMPMMAAADFRATGDTALAARNYDALKAKLLTDKARPTDGLLQATAIVDWPQSERDGYNNGQNVGQQVGPEINAVANAFYYHALREMEFLARFLDKSEEVAELDAKAKQVYDSFNATFFDSNRGIYLDGEGSNHASLHANMFALAFDLVPAERQEKVADFIQSKGMAASVYGAQYLLEALYKSGRDDYALSLINSREQSSWFNMIRGGGTMTWEAWDAQFKPNLTWNHAWGAAPANIIARYLVGVTPLAPGYEKISIAPQPGTLASFNAKIPSARGSITVNYRRAKPRLEVDVPSGATARVSLPPALADAASALMLDGKKLAPRNAPRNATPFYEVAAGHHVFEIEATN